MEDFRKKIKLRRFVFLIMALTAVIMTIYDQFAIRNTADGKFEDGVIRGFQFGLILALGILAVVQFVKLSRALIDEKKLKMLYNSEHDERMMLIRSKAGMPMLLITSTLMIIAAVIAGYFNIIVFYTLVAAAVVQLSAGAAVKLYCMKKI